MVCTKRCYRSNSDRIASNIYNVIGYFQNNQINTIFIGGKVCLCRYNDDLFFLGTPHWGIHNATPYFLELYKANNVDETIKNGFSVSVKSSKRKDEDWIPHYLKYYYVYGRSNHMALCYISEEQIIEHEKMRKEFRWYCRHELHLDFTLDALINYLKENKDNLPDRMKYFINRERILNNVYKFYCINMSASDIFKNIVHREDWVTDVDMIKI